MKAGTTLFSLPFISLVFLPSDSTALLPSHWLILQIGKNPLHLAAEGGHTAAMELLIKSGVKDLEAKDKVSPPHLYSPPPSTSWPLESTD